MTILWIVTALCDKTGNIASNGTWRTDLGVFHYTIMASSLKVSPLYHIFEDQINTFRPVLPFVSEIRRVYTIAALCMISVEILSCMLGLETCLWSHISWCNERRSLLLQRAAPWALLKTSYWNIFDILIAGLLFNDGLTGVACDPIGSIFSVCTVTI